MKALYRHKQSGDIFGIEANEAGQAHPCPFFAAAHCIHNAPHRSITGAGTPLVNRIRSTSQDRLCAPERMGIDVRGQVNCRVPQKGLGGQKTAGSVP